MRARRNKVVGVGLVTASVCGLLVTTAPADKAEAVPAFTSKVVAGRSSVRDAVGSTWASKSSNWVGGRVGTSRHHIAGAYGSALLQHDILGATGYRVSVPKAGKYRVTVLAAETTNLGPGQRRFAITAEGRTAVGNVDIAARVGHNRTTAITFDVTVTDGQLNLGFQAIRNQTLLSAVAVSSTWAAPAPASTTSSLAVKLAANNAWSMSVANAPVASNSATVVRNLAGQVSGHWGGVAAFNVSQYNVSFYKVPSSTRKITVGFDDCQGKGYVPAGLYGAGGQFTNVPIPANAAPATGADREMTIYDPAADKLWEFWQMTRTSTGWKACWGGRIDAVSQNRGYFTNHFGTAAAGTIMASGMVTIADIKRGSINHAMYLTAIDVRAGEFHWPAQRTDGATNSASVVVEGDRLRLDPRINVNALPLTPIGKMVARAAQQYGFIVSDKGGAVGVITESGQATKAATGTDPWPGLLGGTPEYSQLRSFPWSNLQLLPAHYGR